MIYLKLFLTFFEIGLFTFGGGYAMISLVMEKGQMWLTEAELDRKSTRLNSSHVT